MHESQVFLEALTRDGQADRASYLDAACAGDPRLRADVEALLRAHDTDPDFLESPAAETPPPADALTAFGPNTERPGAVLAGRYTLVELIGEGGMGSVWKAWQTEPVRRPVAIKLIKRGMDSKAVLARFEAERQALALMDHANIARVFDAATAPDGRSFFVMELVDGAPVTRFCDEHRLTIRQRLELFVAVCQAVQHAHQKGVIHRDLKPGNVLVAACDGRPVPKVIDFGVAKATGPQLTEESVHTHVGTMIGTPEYMSPEQAKLTSIDVDTRSDVYSLGVLLYELLTGGPPFSRQAAEDSGLLELLRVIREDEPPLSSARLAIAAALPALAASRGTDAARLRRQVRGELDWIAMKALEKDRVRRYETAGALAQDVQRYLAEEPVQAGVPSAGYRLRKFVRRHRRALAAASVAAIGLVAALAVVAWSIGWVERDRAARQADAERDMEREMLDAALRRDSGDRVAARAAVKRLERLLPADATDWRKRLAQIVKDLNMLERLEEIALRPPEMGNHIGLYIYRRRLGTAYVAAFREYGIDVVGHPTEAVAKAIRASPIRTQLTAAVDDWLWCELLKAGFGLRTEIKVSPECAHLRDVADEAFPNQWSRTIRASLSTLDQKALLDLAARPEVASQPTSTQLLLARMLQHAKAWDKAVEVLLGLQQRDPNDVIVNCELALVLSKRVKPARPADAIGFMRAAVAARPEHVVLRNHLGNVLTEAKQFDSAISVYRQVLEMDTNNRPARFGWQLALVGKGQAAADRFDWPAAVGEYSAAIEMDQSDMNARYGRGSCFVRLTRWSDAVGDLSKVIAGRPNDGLSRFMLAASLLKGGDVAGYRQVCTEGVGRLPKDKVFNAAYHLVLACGLAPDAVRDLTAPIELIGHYVPTNRAAWSLHALGLAHFRAGQFPEAITSLKESRSLDARWDDLTCENGLVLAMAYHRQGETDKAREELKRTTDRLERGARAAKPPRTFPDHIVAWLSAQILRTEAEALILGAAR